MSSAKLDMALDEVIESSSWGSNNGGKGSDDRWGSRSGEASSASWGRSSGKAGAMARGASTEEGADGSLTGTTGNGIRSPGSRQNSKLDMSLDEVIETSGGWWGKSGSWGGKDKGKGHGASWGWNGRGGKGSDRGPPRWQPPTRGSSPSWRRSEQGSSWGDRGGMRSAGGERYNDRYGMRRSRGEDEASYRYVKRIKVANVPRDLAARDIKHAFEAEAGKTTSCELDRGIAYLSFVKPEDARKAVETFDRGELNGKIITVTLEP